MQSRGRSTRNKVVRLLGVMVVVLLLGLAWSHTNKAKGIEDLFEHNIKQGRPVELMRLRQLGEALARMFPGAKDMGMGAAPTADLRPVDWSRVRASCTPRGSGASAKVVLVTGTGGFVASGVAIHLRQRGDGVVGLDNFNDYYPVALKRARQLAGEAAGVFTVDGDLNDQPLLDRLFDTCRFTHVLHLAAQAGVRYATRNPYSYVHANLAGHVALMEVAKAQRHPPAIVYASSSSVYGLNTQQPFSEDHRVDAPASLYAATKRADELINHVYYNIHRLSSTGLRFFTVYGPWGRPDMAAFAFAVKIMKGEPIKIFQGPEQQELRRDFTYIDDIVAGVIGSLDAVPASGKDSAHYRIFNLGNTSPHTVSELVDALEKHLGRQAVRQYVPVPPTGDVLATFADVGHAREAFGYAPNTTLDEGIRRFTNWFRDYYGAAAMEGRSQPQDWSYKPM